MVCGSVVEYRCENNHLQRKECHQREPKSCHKCQAEANEKRKRLERQAKLDADAAEHAAAMAQLDDQILQQRQMGEDERTSRERMEALKQKKRDLEAVQANTKLAQKFQQESQETATRTQDQNVTDLPTTNPRGEGNETQTTLSKEQGPQSEPEKIWDRQKRVEGASNAAIDELMALTGLEDVKMKVLNIKGKIETVLRQGTDMKKERLGLVLLGNPGTGEQMRFLDQNMANLLHR